ncbi:MAG: ABC transporter permease [Chloroflexota bacterium]|nr:MAG: ABC transporter permease [Chloroflexota bacterium]
MVPIAWHILFKDKLRLAISVSGVALSIMLVLLLDGFLTGMSEQVTAYIDNTPADYYVGQKGVANLQGAGSVIPLDTLQKVEAVESVASALPVFAQYAILDLHGKKVTTFLIGYEPERGGGSWQLSAGRTVESADEIVVDRVLAQRHGLRAGDELDLLGRPFRIVGLSEGTTSWMVSMIFLRHDAATTLLRAQDTTSFILVRSGEGAVVAERLRASLPDVNVLPRETLLRNDIAFLAGTFSTPLRMMVLIAVGIGALLVGLTIYSATVERVREYGVLKAVGMRNRSLYAIVARQALGAAVLGLIGGLVLVWIVAAAIEYVWPQFLIAVDRGSVVQAGIGAIAIALMASLIPARYVGNIDPARIFRR